MLIQHKDSVFEDQVIYLSGNAYTNCEFHRCVFVITGAPAVFTHNAVHVCSLDLNCFLPDQESLDNLTQLLQILRPALPAPSDTNPTSDTEVSQT